MLIPNRKGWLIISTPLIIWVTCAGVFHVIAWKSYQVFQAEMGAHEEEMKQRGVLVFATENGDRYHRKSHKVVAPIHPIAHPLAMEKGLTPCLVCSPIPLRKMPDPPTEDLKARTVLQQIHWCFGIVILVWVAFLSLPPLLKRSFVREI